MKEFSDNTWLQEMEAAFGPVAIETENADPELLAWSRPVYADNAGVLRTLFPEAYPERIITRHPRPGVY